MAAKSISVIGSGLAITLLGGCLGTDNPDFNKQALEAIRFVNQLEELPPTGSDDMPTGSATYNGVATLNYDEPLSDSNPNADLFADVTMTAEFDTNDITGTFDNFNSPQGNMTGEVAVTDGAIVSNLMQANAGGTISDDSGSTTLDLDIAGQFRGEGAEALTGIITGNYNLDTGTSGDIFGSFGVSQEE